MPNLDLFKLSQQQKNNVISKIIDESAPTAPFLLVLIISIIITTYGLLLDNVAIVIGGMLVSPLLSPLISISLGVVIGDYKCIYRSVKILLKAIAFVVGISLLISLTIINKEMTYEIASRAEPNLLYFYVAIASGIAAAFSYTREEFSERVTGVAVAIAVLPPLAVLGIGISMLNWPVVFGALSLFLVNFFGIVLASVVVFSLYRMYPAKQQVEKELKEEEKEMEENKKDNK